MENQACPLEYYILLHGFPILVGYFYDIRLFWGLEFQDIEHIIPCLTFFMNQAEPMSLVGIQLVA